ncbi:putative zinc-binding CMP/dCMP deaminase protein [Magnetofaba australis IT-1]|uniref:Putative zinc-binding CMP/dCMP deaminase protein n=1 Tax=Magnetofaba australis IT-1 TaxID=1434232 RepID=A0A1Y2K894_9PROT|nr:putative zinc-binding CMP/dCMP deaminase protein [Magnetofaba australis IT-1]
MGALISDAAGRWISSGGNRAISAHDPVAHAEIIALRIAGRRLRNYRLNDCHLWVSLSPCPICAAACAEARIASIHSAAPRLQAHAPQSAQQTQSADDNPVNALSARWLRFFFAPRR